ncbi:hypothetical protein U9M48_033417 [Paspalum notatum var. saurae]|uniref:Uncharacterized protein n=1 Tax=Paspalum notatum var. saurae TaxID=547442 RepID=A0AAQ3X5I5_PASNO
MSSRISSTAASIRIRHSTSLIHREMRRARVAQREVDRSGRAVATVLKFTGTTSYALVRAGKDGETSSR